MVTVSDYYSSPSDRRNKGMIITSRTETKTRKVIKTEAIWLGKVTLTPSCLEKRLRQTLRLEQVSCDSSHTSCIFCNTGDVNSAGTKADVRLVNEAYPFQNPSCQEKHHTLSPLYETRRRISTKINCNLLEDELMWTCLMSFPLKALRKAAHISSSRPAYTHCIQPGGKVESQNIL